MPHPIEMPNFREGMTSMMLTKPDAGAPLIAIIDTDPALRTFLDEFLTAEGFETILCPDPSAAVSLTRMRRPDLVLLNLWLNHQRDGMQILAALRRDDSMATLPVILLSTEDGSLAMGPDASGHLRCLELTMPFDLEDLLAKVTLGLSATLSEVDESR
ncbi:MAG TPA: response regulator [Nitrolancea sp.]|nr:response regulator [Nitrolancea sp.]